MRFIQKNKHEFYQTLVVLNVVFLVLLFLEFIFPGNYLIRDLEIAFGLVFLFELVLHIWMSNGDMKKIFHWLNIVDVIIIFSIFERFLFEDSIWLHIVSSLRILRSYRAIEIITQSNKSLYRYHDIIMSIANLLVFIFIMSAIVFVSQVGKNPSMQNYIDALYFTVTTLTTTGFGDIIIVGKDGKLLVILIMTFGVGLFLKLATSIFRPSKAYYTCKHCGLRKHDKDASHCKHCGNIILIETEGDIEH